MKVFVTGATGLVGRSFIAEALAQGADVVAAGRDPRPGAWPEGVETVRWPGGPLDLSDVDVVVHLAGASIGGRRWSRPYMQELRDSRIATTEALVAAMVPGQVLVSASAVGYYGRDPKGSCLEDRAPGDDFLARLCADWEAAARQAPGRNVQMRFGHVLAPGEGLLGRLEPLHRARVAGIVGSGQQCLPWIHADDLARALCWAATSSAAGPVNAVVDNVPYRELHAQLCRRIGGLPWLRIPTPALRVGLGRFAPYLVGGQEVVPQRLRKAGFRPEHPDLDAALDACYPGGS